MSLSYYKLVIILDADAGGQNAAANQALEIQKLTGGLANIYEDADGLNPITQPGATTDSQGGFEFYASSGIYKVVSGSYEEQIKVGIDSDGGIYIEAFGAVGDGGTDDSDAINDAITAAVSDGHKAIHTNLPYLNFNSNIDFKGLGIIGNGAIYQPNGKVVTDLAFIRGMRQDDGSTDRLIDDPMTSEGSAITHGDFKIVYEDGGRVFCATKGGASKRGLLYEMLTGNYVAPSLPSNSLNTNWELWRIVSVACLDECIVYKREDSKTGTWSTFNPTLTALGLSGSGSLLKAEGAESSTTGNTITFTANADRKGKMTVCFQMSSGSDTACEIRVDGTLYDTIDLSNPTTELYNYEITTTPGSHTIEVTHGAGAVLRVLGCNLKSISEINEYFDEDYDGIGVYTSASPFYYIPRYQTSDYAFRDTIDDLWGGSYHGGETAVEPPVWSLDGNTIDPTASGYIGIGRAFSVFQRTQIDWSTQSLQLNNSLRFGDSQYQQAISSVGEVQIKTFHNGMLGSSIDFETMLSTTYTDDASTTYDAQLMGNSLRLEQVAKDTGRRIVVEFTPLDRNNSPDYNGFTVSNVSDSYFKLYRGFVRNADQKMVNPSWVYTVTFG